MNIKNIFKPTNVNLVRELVISEFKLRYQGSVLGYVWSLLRPLMMFAVLYVVFTQIIRLGTDIPHYPVYLLLGLVLWTFFTEATMGGMNAITGRGDLVRKVSIPKYLIVVSTNISALVNFFLNMLVVFIFMFFTGADMSIGMLWVPLLLLELFIFCLALSFLLAALFVKYRDISHIWEVILQALFYATPIIYAFAIVPPFIAQFVALSPLTQIIQDIREVMITPATLTSQEVNTSLLGQLAPFIIVLVLLVVSVTYFKRNAHKFAEEL